MLYDPKTNSTYPSLWQLPLSSIRDSSKSSQKQLLAQYDSFYDFFYNGRQLKAQQIEQSLQKKFQSQYFVIVAQKYQETLKSPQKVSYESYRNVIEHYLRTTKSKQVQKIRQNAEFIFEKSIDKNFKYLTFERFDHQQEFTQQRKQELLSKVFLKLCQESSDENNDTEELKQNKYQSRSKKSKQSQLQKNGQSQKLDLELHELEYITENWKELICINKYLLRTNLDNLSFQETIKSLKVKNSDQNQQKQDEVII